MWHATPSAPASSISARWTSGKAACLTRSRPARATPLPLLGLQTLGPELSFSEHVLILSTEIYSIEKLAARDRARHVFKDQVECHRNVAIEIVGRTMRRDQQIRRIPKVRLRRQWLGIKDVENGTRERTRPQPRGERTIIDQLRP